MQNVDSLEAPNPRTYINIRNVGHTVHTNQMFYLFTFFITQTLILVVRVLQVIFKELTT